MAADPGDGHPANARGAGCGCKLPPGLLRRALAGMPGLPADPDILVSHAGSDDAAVYRVAPDLAVVASVDFFTPVVADPKTFGAIAATNALSDLYAMGARPTMALALVAHPRDGDSEHLAAIMRGGAEAALRQGCPVLGGHSIDDPEVKYGLAVIGTAHPDALMVNSAGAAGDFLYLTKPLGIGTAIAAGDAALRARAVATMLEPNAAAAAAAAAAGVRCATDVTGFGLAGHLSELAAASGLAATIDPERLAVLAGVEALARAGRVPGGARRNQADLGARVMLAPGVTLPVEVLFDPQTSGGLLLAVGPDRAERLEAELAARDLPSRPIGRLVPGELGRIGVGAAALVG